MPFNELVAPSLTDLFVRQMEHMILSGELQPGEKLPTERELSQKMRVSLAVVNRGINKLADFGFLTIRPRKGVYVNDYVRTGNMDTLNAIMSFIGNYFDPEYYEPLANVRKSVEPFIIRDACRHRSDRDLTNLGRARGEFERAREAESAAEAAYRFQHEMAIAARNEVYPLLVAEAKELITGSYEAIFKIIGKKKYQVFFDGMLDAVSRKDEPAAKELLEKYESLWDDLYNGVDE